MYGYGKHPTLAEELEKGRRRDWQWIIGVFIAALLIWIFRGSSSTSINFDNDSLTVTGPEKRTQSIALCELQRLDLLTEAEFGICQDGKENGQNCCGTWENSTWGTYFLCIQKDVPCVIAAWGSDGSVIVFNYLDETQTIQVFDLILGVMESKGLPFPEIE